MTATALLTMLKCVPDGAGELSCSPLSSEHSEVLQYGAEGMDCKVGSNALYDDHDVSMCCMR